MLALQNICVIFLFYGIVFSRSIGNSTAEEGKSITMEMWEQLMKNMTDLETKIEKRVQIEKKHVFFYAELPSADVILNANSIVKFSEVLNNEGNHFNSGDSIFIAPVSGVYMFSWTTQTISAKTVNTELMVDNVMKDNLHASIGGQVGRVSVTRVCVCNVVKDEHVWIQTSRYVSENYFEYDEHSGSSFMGILLYET